MQLKLRELQRVAKETMKEEKFSSALREELFRIFGPPVMVSKNCEMVAEAVNEQLDLFESTGRAVPTVETRISLFLEAANSKSTIIRKVAARLLPEKHVVGMLSDKSTIVRCAAAKRLPYSKIKTAVKMHPGDDQLVTIVRSKRISEAGLPNPKAVTEPFDLYGEKPLGDASKRVAPDDLSDEWYERLAHKLCKEYGSNLEGQWEEILATRVVASHYATSGVKLDRDKLLKSIYDCLKDRDDAVLGEGSLRNIVRSLRESSHLDDAAMPIIEDTTDPVLDLTESNLSTSEYVRRAEAVFSVKKSTVPAGIKKYRIGEGHNFETLIPVNGQVPGKKITPRVEQALDEYVSRWNDQQASRGEPYRVSWSPNPMDAGRIGFHMELK